MMGFAAMHPVSPQAAMSSEDVIGLHAASERKESGMQGWYRTYLPAQVRAEQGMQSEMVDTLYAGSLVYVAETHGLHARILKPVKGWVSLRTSDGITVLRPDMTYQASPNKTDIEAVFRSRAVREANERLQESAVRLTAVQKQLMETLKKMKQIPK